MADPMLREGADVFSFPAGQKISRQQLQVAIQRERPHSDPVVEETWFDQVAKFVRVVAQTVPGLTAAFVSRDGRQVIVTAPAWTPELNRAGASLVTALLRELHPDEQHWIEGGFQPQFEGTAGDFERVFGRP